MKDIMADEPQRFSVEVVGDYINLKTEGKLDVHNLDAPAMAALALAKERGIDKLLDDIRGVDTTGFNIPIQTKSMGIIWKLRSFRKVAIVMNSSRIRTIFFSTLEALHLNLDAKFKSFDNDAEAVAWLQED